MVVKDFNREWKKSMEGYTKGVTPKEQMLKTLAEIMLSEPDMETFAFYMEGIVAIPEMDYLTLSILKQKKK